MSSADPSRRRLALWIIPPLLQLAFALPLLDRVPRLYNDEAWEASLGQQVAEHGALRHGIIQGWGGMHVHFVQNQVVMPFVLAPVFKLLGVGAWQARFASVLISAVAVFCIHGAMRRCLSARAALGVALLVVIHPWFFTISRCARPEIYYVAAGYAALWALLATIDSAPAWHGHPARAKRPGPTHQATISAVLFGLFAGLATLTHPTGLVLIAAMIGGSMVGFGWRRVLRVAPLAGLAFVLTLLPYAIYVAWAGRDPAVSFFQQMTGHRETPLEFGRPFRLVLDEWARWKHFFQWPYGAPILVLLLYAWADAWRGRRAGPSDRAAAAMILLFALAMPFTTVNTTSRYLIALVPLFAYLLVRLVQRTAVRDARSAAESPSPHAAPFQAEGADDAAAHQPRPARLVLAVALIAAYALPSLAAVGLLFVRLRDADLNRVLERVAAVTGPDARVFGRMLLWFGEPRYQYGPFPIDHRWRIDDAAVRAAGFAYAVRSAWDFGSSGGLASPPAQMPPFRETDDIDPICRRYGTLVAAFRDPAFGPFEVYKLDFAKGDQSASERP